MICKNIPNEQTNVFFWLLTAPHLIDYRPHPLIIPLAVVIGLKGKQLVGEVNVGYKLSAGLVVWYCIEWQAWFTWKDQLQSKQTEEQILDESKQKNLIPAAEGLIVIIICFEEDHNGYNTLVGAKRLVHIIGILIAWVHMNSR